MLSNPVLRVIGAVVAALLVASVWRPISEMLPAEWVMALVGLVLVALAVLALRVLRSGMDGPRR
jgi:putative Ca2+/H+ antiporter (TMEM165/GDT1 family)